MLAAAGVDFILAQDFDDARHLAGADKQIDFRKLSSELFRIALR